MIEKLRQFLLKYNIKNKKVLLGFSSGPDSCALALSLEELKKEFLLDITLLYFNHQWREEAINEETFTKEFALEHGFNYIIGKAPENSKKTEEKARELRYSFFLKQAQKLKSDVVFLAHNKNDNIETLIYRIIKGTSISGLQAMKEKREIFYRPFLGVEKKEILNFLKEKKQNYMVDLSNDDTKYKRNLIRKEILPYFEKINPNYLDNINNLIQNASYTRLIVEKEIEKIEKRLIINSKIKRNEFINLEKQYRYEILNRYLSDYLKYRNYKNIIMYDNFINQNKSSKISLNRDCFLVIKNDFIEIVKKNLKSEDEIIIDKEGEYIFEDIILKIEKIKKNDNNYKSTKNSCFLDLDFPVVIRHRKNGDKFSPYGLKGSMKLKDYLINEKIEQSKKDRLILIAKEKEICWILGYKTSEKYKVQKEICYKLEAGRING